MCNSPTCCYYHHMREGRLMVELSHFLSYLIVNCLISTPENVRDLWYLPSEFPSLKYDDLLCCRKSWVVLIIFLLIRYWRSCFAFNQPSTTRNHYRTKTGKHNRTFFRKLANYYHCQSVVPYVVFCLYRDLFVEKSNPADLCGRWPLCTFVSFGQHVGEGS